VALVTWPLSSGEARGRVGDLVYNTWRGKSYVKAHKHYQTGLSDPQKAVQAITAQATITWQGFSQATRDVWDAYAATHLIHHWSGTPKRLSGYNWFVRCRFNQIQGIGYLSDLTPPPGLDLVLLDPFLEAYSLNIDVYWTPQTSEIDLSWWVNIWLEGPHSPAVTPSIKRAHNELWISESITPASIPVLEAGYYTVHLRPVHRSGRPDIFQHLTIYCPLE
jgi:hypothetical protein